MKGTCGQWDDQESSRENSNLAGSAPENAAAPKRLSANLTPDCPKGSLSLRYKSCHADNMFLAHTLPPIPATVGGHT
ncbi:hypothetical protein GCM10027046_25170 [Uliginosibacterium flavum]